MMNLFSSRMSRGAVLFAAIVGAGGGTACSGSNNVGTLRESWTIDGSQDANACTQRGAAQLRLVVVDTSNVVSATQFASCSDFQTSLALSPQVYSATATFLDTNGTPVSQALTLPPFAIFLEQTTNQSVNFSPADFFR
jgi:hypothetical protein